MCLEHPCSTEGRLTARNYNNKLKKSVLSGSQLEKKGGGEEEEIQNYFLVY